jgi:hypothetical protein
MVTNYMNAISQQPVKIADVVREMQKYSVNVGSTGEKASRAQLTALLDTFDGMDGLAKDAQLSQREQFLARETLRNGSLSSLGWEVVAVSIEDVVGAANMVVGEPRNARDLLESGAGVAMPIRTILKDK